MTRPHVLPFSDISDYKTMLYRSTLDLGGMGAEADVKTWVDFADGRQDLNLYDNKLYNGLKCFLSLNRVHVS